MNTQMLTLVSTLAIIAVVLVMIGFGWRNRLKRQADVDPLPPVPAEPGVPSAEADGQYVASTTSGDWPDRIAVHGLGLRTNAVLRVYPHGVLLDRSGAPALYIPAPSLTAVRQESGMAGKFVEKDGLLVLTWDLGTHSLDTGFRTRRAADKEALYDSLQQLIAAGPQEHSQDPQSGK
ncbi:MAG: transporter [Pseudarthrobacter sp.]